MSGPAQCCLIAPDLSQAICDTDVMSLLRCANRQSDQKPVGADDCHREESTIPLTNEVKTELVTQAVDCREPDRSDGQRHIKTEASGPNGADCFDGTNRPPCSCGVAAAPSLYRWIFMGAPQYQCSLCQRLLGSNSSNAHVHMWRQHAVDDPCVVQLDTGESTHRKRRSIARAESTEAAVRRADRKRKSSGRSTCSSACWERFIFAVLNISRSSRPNQPLFDCDTPAEQYCDDETHKRSGDAPPTAKTMRGKWAAVREHLIAGRTSANVAGSKGLFTFHVP